MGKIGKAILQTTLALSLGGYAWYKYERHKQHQEQLNTYLDNIRDKQGGFFEIDKTFSKKEIQQFAQAFSEADQQSMTISISNTSPENLTVLLDAFQKGPVVDELWINMPFDIDFLQPLLQNQKIKSLVLDNDNLAFDSIIPLMESSLQQLNISSFKGAFTDREAKMLVKAIQKTDLQYFYIAIYGVDRNPISLSPESQQAFLQAFVSKKNFRGGVSPMYGYYPLSEAIEAEMNRRQNL